MRIAQSAQEDRERGQTEIGLCLSAASWKEDQFDDVAFFMLLLRGRCERSKDESDLERPPRAAAGNTRLKGAFNLESHCLRVETRRASRVTASLLLQQHRVVRKAECALCKRL